MFTKTGVDKVGALLVLLQSLGELGGGLVDVALGQLRFRLLEQVATSLGFLFRSRRWDNATQNSLVSKRPVLRRLAFLEC
jgi:hypothetical protein